MSRVMSVLPDHPVTVALPLQWGEMDAFGHVNNVVYFRYFETARIACFERLGYLEMVEDQGQGPILASTSCRFRRPLAYPDQLTVGARIGAVDSDRFVMHYAVHSASLDDIAAVGEGLIVHFDYKNGRKTALPEALRVALISLRGG